MSDQIVKLNPGDAFRPSAVMHNYVVDIIREYQRGQPSERAQASDDNLVYVKNGDSEPAAINSEIATITDKLAKLEQMVIVEGPGSYLSADSWVFGSDVNQVCGRTVTQQLEDATDQLDRLQNQLASIEPGTITLGMHAVVGLGDPSVSPNSDNRHLFNIVFDVASPSPSDRFGITQEPADIGSIAEVMITGETWVLVEVTDESHEYASPIAGNYERLLSQAAVGPAKIIWKEDGTGILWAYVLVDHSTAGTAGSTISGDAIWCNCTISAGVLTLEDQAGMSFVMRSSAGVYVIGFAASYATDESFTWSYYCGNSPVTLFEVGRTPNSVTVQTSTGLDVDRFGIDVHGRIGIPTTDPLPSSACGVCTTTQDTYCITFDGIATYSFYLINLCETWLSQVEVSRVGDGTGCAWDWAGPTNAIYPDTHLYVNFSYADGYWVLSVSAFLLYGYPMVQIAVYSASSAAWNCQTPLVLTKQSSTTTDICTNWPATVTVRPGSCANLPSIELRTTALPPTATTMTITGQNFETGTPGNNVLTFNRGMSGTVTASTATTLTVNITVAPTSNGILTATVVNTNGTSAPAVQVATVVARPTLTPNTSQLSSSAATITIAGTGFDTVASGNIVTFNRGAVGTVTTATTNQLIVTFTTLPTSNGSLTATVVNTNGTSAPAAQVATIVPPPAVGTDWYDTFTDANSTAAALHSPEVGSSYSIFFGLCEISSNALIVKTNSTAFSGDHTATGSMVLFDPGTVQNTIDFDFSLDNAAGVSQVYCLLRYDDTSTTGNGFLVRVSSTLVVIYQISGGAATVVGGPYLMSPGLSADTIYHLEVTDTGSIITVTTPDGLALVSVTDSTNNTQTRIAVGAGNFFGEDATNIDNLSVVGT